MPVNQTLHLAVYSKKGRRAFLLRDVEDDLTQRHLVLTRGAPILALPLLIHRRWLNGTEEALQRQLVGYADGTQLVIS